jgi:hypothetical protein
VRVLSNYASAGTDGLGFQIEAKLEQSGDFEFPALPPGSYRLTAVARPPQKATSNPMELIFYQTEYKQHVLVQVGALPVDNVQIVVDTGSEVTGRVSIVDDETAKISRGVITFQNSDGGQIHGFIHDDQKFTVSLAPGHYIIGQEVGREFVMESVQSGARNIFDEGLTISDEAKIFLEVKLSKNGGQVDGVVVDKDDRPVTGATVVLIPEARLRARSDFFRQGETDQNGHYEIKAIPAGAYKLLAWEDVEPGIWWDPDFLKEHESKGENVIAKPKDHASIRLAVVPSEKR